MPTMASKFITILTALRDACAQKLLDVEAGGDTMMTFSLDGVSMSQNEYVDALQKRLDKYTEMLQRQQPFTVISRGRA